MVQIIAFNDNCKSSLRIRKIKKKKIPPNHNNDNTNNQADLNFDVSWFLNPSLTIPIQQPQAQNPSNAQTKRPLAISNDCRNIQQQQQKARNPCNIQKKRKHPVGLQNPANYCYMNSVIQIFKNIPEILQYFLNDEIFNLQSKINVNSNEFNVVKDFSALLRRLDDGDSNISAKTFKEAFGSWKKTFDNNNQQDAHEFLLYLLELLSNFSNDSPISNLFGIEITNKITCNDCSFEKNTPSTILNCLHLSFSREKVTLLNELLNSNFTTKELYWTCEDCCERGYASQQQLFLKLPPILLIQFNRFDELGEKKLDFIKFPTKNLNISEYVIEHATDKNNSYELVSIIFHIGINTTKGHYISCCKNSNDKKWYEFDDTRVQNIPNINDYIVMENDDNKNRQNTNEKSDKTAYILFYRKK